MKLRFSRREFLGIFCKIIIIAMRFCKCIMKNASTKPHSGSFLDFPLLSVRAHITNVWLSPPRYPEPGRGWRIFRRVIKINCNPWGYTWGAGMVFGKNWTMHWSLINGALTSLQRFLMQRSSDSLYPPLLYAKRERLRLIQVYRSSTHVWEYFSYYSKQRCLVLKLRWKTSFRSRCTSSSL